MLLTQLETPSALTAHITARGREHGMTVILDPAPAAELAAEIWRSIDIVTPNETEASLISGIQVTDAASAERAGHWFLEQGVGAAVITLAGQGSCVVTAEGATVVPPFPVEAVDTTRRGRRLCRLPRRRARERSGPHRCVRLATAAGALTVTKQGASPSLPHRADVEAFLAARTAAPVAN
ncbi:PfkB family carbohydrate kinase [Microbacterium sp. NRRL B-14842]|uniref:PfkB family carbohydrate kinase n=1 Tax=Microbacterium sp. NRRL B-14842 TaxID=3162881 RepID=UPI003D2714F3